MKFLDLQSQYQTIQADVESAVLAVLRSGRYIGGEVVADFEEAVASYCGVKHAISLNSGTDALFFALKGLGIGPGDEVVTTPFSFFATAEVIANLGAKPVFVDIDPDTFTIDATKIGQAVTAHTKAIIPVHIFGQSADMEPIMAVAKAHNLFVIEDAAQSFGGVYADTPSGAIGDAGCFSFFPSKNLGACGDGGMIVTNNDELAAQVRFLKSHGSSKQDKYSNVLLGYNSRLDALQAAVLQVKLRHVDAWNAARREKAAYYAQAFVGVPQVRVPAMAYGAAPVFHQYTIEVDGDRDALRDHLTDLGIPTMVYYATPLYAQPALASFGYDRQDFPVCERVSRRVLSLPIYPELSAVDQDRVVEGIVSFFQK